MNPREFCQKSGYRSALVLTWSFDALFFERLVYHDLRVGGAGTVLVLADQAQVRSSLRSWPDQLQLLGRSYLLEPVYGPRHFHPKVILRLGPEGGCVWVGSGNVTHGGWGQQRELASAWRFGPDSPDTGAWVGPLLETASSWCRSVRARDAIQLMADEPWIVAAEAGAVGSALVWSAGQASLAAILEERWAGRRFTEVRVSTGSTDSEGAFLRWAHDVFGVERAVVAVNPGRASFAKERLEELPLAVEFVNPNKGGGILHAKLCWFDGDEGSAAVMGSANCSAAAWLWSPDRGGNVEAVVAFDEAERTDFVAAMADFEGERLAPADFLPPYAANSPDAEFPPTPAYSLCQVEIDSETGRALVRIEPDPAVTAQVILLVGREENTLIRERPEVFVGPLPESAGSIRSLFATARIVVDDQVVETDPRWIDQLADLHEARRDRRASNVLDRFRLASDRSEHRKLMQDLHIVMDALIGDRAGFSDSLVTGSRKRSDVPAEAARQLNPDDLVVHLRDHRVERPAPGMSGGLPASLSGVLRALFPPEDEDHDESGEEDEPELREANQDAIGPTPAGDTGEPAEKLKRRLRKELTTFLEKLKSRDFARTCTASQLVQAVSFPLALSVLGPRSGWMDESDGPHWAWEVVRTLFHHPLSPDTGLLNAVHARFTSEQREEVFLNVVGDGLLWATLGSVLAGFPAVNPGERIERAVLLREVNAHPELIAPHAAESLSQLAHRLQRSGALAALIAEMPGAVSALADLEALLEAHWSEWIAEQEASPGKHRVGDPLWRPEVGWVFAEEEVRVDVSRLMILRPWHPAQFSKESPQVAAARYYLNVRLAALGHPDLDRRIASLASS